MLLLEIMNRMVSVPCYRIGADQYNIVPVGIMQICMVMLHNPIETERQ